MNILLKHLGSQSKYSLLVRGYLTVLVIMLADLVTGPDPSFFVFYFIPIIIIAWYVGRKQGLLLTLAATSAMLVHDLLFMNPSALLSNSSLLAFWGLAQRSMALLIVCVTVSAVKTAEEEKKTLEYQIASEVESFLLCGTAPSMPHFSCHGHTKPSAHLSGDILELVSLGPTSLGIVVGDVCGKGVSAALLVAYLRGMLRNHRSLQARTLDRLMRRLNSSLFHSTPEEMFVTLFIGVYDDADRTLTYVNAGHTPPFVLRWGGAEGPRRPVEGMLRNGRLSADSRMGGGLKTMRLENNGLILGVEPLAEYSQQVVRLNPGDVLVCVTDGVDEARNHLGEPYGLERLGRVLSAHREKSPREMHRLAMDDIEDFISMESQHDDMTIVIGKVI